MDKTLLGQARKANRETELLNAARSMFKALNKAVWVPDNIADLIAAEQGRPSGFGLAYGKLHDALEGYGRETPDGFQDNAETPEALGAAVFKTISNK